MQKTFIADKETLDKVYGLLAPEEPGGETMGDKLDSCKETLGRVYGMLSGEEVSDEVFGFIEHNSILASGSRISYIGANKNYNPITVTKGGGYSLGDWADFPVIAENKPWMVHEDGFPDYRLLEDDYSFKEDGVTASDVANASYEGGAFSWLKKIYKQEYMVGLDRVVKFSFKKRDGFHANGFIDEYGNELKGVWLPMFYGAIVSSSTNIKMTSLSVSQFDYSLTSDSQESAIGGFSPMAKFLGGPIVNTITDLLIMWGKDTNIKGVYGSGNNSGYVNAPPAYGMKANAVISGGQFFGTSDGKSLNKILHSIVLGSWQQWMRDPYTMCVNGRVKVSKNYVYNLTGETYEDAGISYPGIVSSAAYPHKYRTVPGFGALPEYPYKGSSATGGCDGFLVDAGIAAVARRFGACNVGLACGPRALDFTATAFFTSWNCGCAILLLGPKET